MPAAADIRTYLLPYAGCSTVDRLPAGTATRMLSDLNAALQALYTGDRREWKSAALRAPTTITIDAVTHGSTDITFAGFDAWMAGCTVRISGDHRDNRFCAGMAALENPYLGTGGANVMATVYGDCVTGDIDVAKVLEPMTIDRRYDVQLIPLATIEQMMLGRDHKPMQRPCLAGLEDALSAAGPPAVRIVLDSLPQEAGLLRYRAVVRAPVVASWNDTREFLLPNGLDASVLKPMVLFLFSTHPDFTGDAGQVAKAASVASDIWKQTSSLGLERRQVSMMD